MSLAFMMWKGQEGVCGERSGVSMVRRRKGVKQEGGSAIGRPERGQHAAGVWLGGL